VRERWWWNRETPRNISKGESLADSAGRSPRSNGFHDFGHFGFRSRQH
jgi:hypothetical protein